METHSVESSRGSGIGFRVAAILGVLLCSQAAWAATTITPSPSYDGNYTVQWAYPLGCYIYNVYGFPTQVCYEGQEAIDGCYGQSPDVQRTNYWTSGSSVSITDKTSNTYCYTIWATQTAWWGNDVYQATDPVTVQVIRPVPQINSYYYLYSGTSGNPASYVFGWNAAYAYANECDLNIAWYRTGQAWPEEAVLYNLPTTHAVIIPKQYSNTYQVVPKATCYGPGGEGFETQSLYFNPN